LAVEPLMAYHLTKVTALEVAEKGVTCNAICPGYV
jgi:3-hydroxybutyrate dehydrogenase